MNIRRLAPLLALSLLAVLVAVVPGVASAQEEPPEPDWFVDESKLPFDALPGHEDADRQWGVLNGAGYRLEVPADWNGDLVMYAHGFRGQGAELTVSNTPIRQYLLDNGFAWAASSYTANGYDVRSGVRSTAELATYFGLEVRSPDRIYIIGFSMGGHITARSVERYAWIYDGAMPMCGVLGDYELFDFFLDYNLGAQQLGTGSSTFPVDPATYISETVPTIKANLEASPGGWPTDLNETGQQFKELVEDRSGAERPNFDEAWAFWNSIDSASGPGNFLFNLGLGDGTLPNSGGLSVVENTGVFYQLDDLGSFSPEELAFNEAVFRTEKEGLARRGERITGDFRVPVLTLHNLGDLFVPFGMEIDYARDVMWRGDPDLLVQRAIRGVRHCGFSDAEMEAGFADLVAWTEGGPRPAGDEMLDPKARAADDYGCRFTDPTPGAHLLATPCPAAGS